MVELLNRVIELGWMPRGKEIKKIREEVPGWYAFENEGGIILTSDIEGIARIDSRLLQFCEREGLLRKDWGRSRDAIVESVWGTEDRIKYFLLHNIKLINEDI